MCKSVSPGPLANLFKASLFKAFLSVDFLSENSKPVIGRADIQSKGDKCGRKEKKLKLQELIIVPILSLTDILTKSCLNFRRNITKMF